PQPAVRLLPVVLRCPRRRVVPGCRHRAAAQPPRELLWLHSAPRAESAPTDRLAAARPVGNDRARRVFAGLRALAPRMRVVSLSRRVPAPAQRHDRAALAAQESRLRPPAVDA